MVALSVLDQAPAREGGEPGHGVREAIELARHADRLGFHRMWAAEHHAMPSVASAAPEVLIGHLAAATRHLRVGSGGVLLPNHRPLHVAEQFQVLEALHPGRIDLGIGRSEGALDERTVLALGRPEDTAHGAGFEEQLDELLAFGGGPPLPVEHPLHGVRATPVGVPLPPVTLLGSSTGSAGTAATKGLGYAFAVHTNPGAAAEALERYRTAFVPSDGRDRPHTMLAVRVAVGEDDEHGRALLAPSRLAIAQMRAGHGGPLKPVDAALAHRWTATEREIDAAQHADADAVGAPATVRERLERWVAETGADEIIAITNTFDPTERLASFTRLADAMGLEAPG